MNGASPGPGAELANKIARLAEEKGWNQEVLAKAARLNRHTVHQILHGGPKRRLRNQTIQQCANALGLTVSELRNLPLDRLLPRMHGKPPGDDESLRWGSMKVAVISRSKAPRISASICSTDVARRSTFRWYTNTRALSELGWPSLPTASMSSRARGSTPSTTTSRSKRKCSTGCDT